MLRQHWGKGVTGNFLGIFPLNPHCLKSAPSCPLLGPVIVLGWGRLSGRVIPQPPQNCLQEGPVFPLPKGLPRAGSFFDFLWIAFNNRRSKLVLISTTAPKFSQPDLSCHCISHVVSLICSKLGSDPSSSFNKPYGWCSSLTHYFYRDPKLGGLLITITFDQRFFNGCLHDGIW